MDPLSITASVLTILQVTRASWRGIDVLLSLRDAPQQLQQLLNEAEALRALLFETQSSLRRRSTPDEYERIKVSITPALQAVKGHVLEFEQFVHSRLCHKDAPGDHALPKVNRSYWLRATPEIHRIKQNIRDSRDILKSQLALLGLEDSHIMKANIAQIQNITLINQDSIRAVKEQQQKLQDGLEQLEQRTQRSIAETEKYVKDSGTNIQTALLEMGIGQRRDFATLEDCVATSMRPLFTQMEQMTLALKEQTFGSAESFQKGTSVQITTTIASQLCPRTCRCQCHFRSAGLTPQWLKGVFGQLMWDYNSSISMRPCNFPTCRKSIGKHHFTYYFPSWLLSRVITVSADLRNLTGPGGKISVDMPLIIPEKDHIIWSFIMAGNIEQLRTLISCDSNLVYVRNQWGQSTMHVAAKIHQPAVFNFLLSIGMDPHAPDENHKSAATTVLTRRGNEDYKLSLDVEDFSDRLGWSDLHQAAAMTREGRRITVELLRAGFDDLNSRDALGRTPLHWLAENGEAGAIQLLTQDPWKANVHIRDNAGFTALHCACWADDLESAVVLLNAGSDPNARDKHKRTPMMHFDDYRLLELMIKHGADVHISDDEGCNILHHVCVSDQATLARVLLELYSDQLCVANHNGDTPLLEAIRNNSVSVLAAWLPFLSTFPVATIEIKNNKKRNALHLMALYASTEAMDILASVDLCKLDADARDNDGHTPNECFIKCRSECCALARKPFKIETESWVRLMKSVRGENYLGCDIIKLEDEIGGESQVAWSRRKDSLLGSRTPASSGTNSDEM